MKLVLTALILFSASFTFAQQKKMNVYFLKNDGRYVQLRDSADYMRIVSEPDSGSVLYNVAEYYLNRTKKLLGQSSKIDPPVFEGQCVTFYKSGSKQSASHYKNGLPVGDEYQFYPNGKAYMVKTYPDNNDLYNGLTNNYLIKAEYDSLGTVLVENGNGYYKSYDNTFKFAEDEGNVKDGKREGIWKGDFKNTKFTETYKDGILIDGVAAYSDGTISKYTNSRGTAPQFNGGIDAFTNYLATHINYPDKEREDNVQGNVVITFVVEKDGKLSSIKVVKSVSKNIDREAIRVITNCPPWTPGTQFGRPARVEYTVPINFTLSD